MIFSLESQFTVIFLHAFLRCKVCLNGINPNIIKLMQLNTCDACIVNLNTDFFIEQNETSILKFVNSM